MYSSWKPVFAVFRLGKQDKQCFSTAEAERREERGNESDTKRVKVTKVFLSKGRRGRGTVRSQEIQKGWWRSGWKA